LGKEGADAEIEKALGLIKLIIKETRESILLPKLELTDREITYLNSNTILKNKVQTADAESSAGLIINGVDSLITDVKKPLLQAA